MGKGDWRRPSSVPKDEYDQNFEAVFGKKKLNVMSDEDRDALALENDDFRESDDDGDREAGGEVPADGHEGRSLHAAAGETVTEGKTSDELRPFWTGPCYRGEYHCPHGVGHGNHSHGCCGFKCCQRPDFPLKRPQKLPIPDVGWPGIGWPK